MNQSPTSLKAIGDPHSGWRSSQPISQPIQSTHPKTQQRLLQRIGITRKLNGIKNFFSFFFFTNGFQRPAGVSRGRGNQLSLWNVHQVPLGIEAGPDPV